MESRISEAHDAIISGIHKRDTVVIAQALLLPCLGRIVSQVHLPRL
jgi:hypothetical protein